MPRFTVDLHNHTPASADFREPDSTTARDIVEAALDAGLDAYGVTDHLSCAFVPKLMAAADAFEQTTGRRLLVVPGAELRVTFGNDEAHIAALFSAGDYEAAFEGLLREVGLGGGALAGRHLPNVTFEFDPAEVCRIVHALGGIACVAHADRTFGTYRLIDSPLFDRLCEEPAVGAIDLRDPAAYGPDVERRGLPVICCSDSHSCAGIGKRSVGLEMDDLSFESLKKALARRPAAVHSTTNGS